MHLVLVESPAKVKSLSGYLGPSYKVMATYGHVRDLPSKTGSVDPKKNFDITFEVVERNKKHLDAIVKASQKAQTVILATDPDREGEAISWHVAEHLKEKKIDTPLQRISFNAITKTAVQEAVQNPRKLDEKLVEAYLARLSLDYLVGFTLSPLLWRKLPGCRSAGRVQSVALRLVCEREAAIEAFQKKEYWSITGHFQTEQKTVLSALKMLEGQKIEKMTLTSEKQALQAVKQATATPYRVTEITKKEVKRHPAPPFMTSTLQQEASRKLNMPPTVTMRLAQQLYEGADQNEGLITYMRTDSITMDGSAIQEVRNHIQSTYGEKFLPSSARVYKRKARNAQEAHEAIRPTSFSRTPENLSGKLSADLLKLYALIWKRALASQMASAHFDQTTQLFKHPTKETYFQATGRVCTFEGFLKVYEEGTDKATDPNDNARMLPNLQEGDAIELEKVEPCQHFTEPPPRFTEASLVKKMEECGIGRPSTYARILQVLKDRTYVVLEKKQVIPKEKGRIVTAFLTLFFRQYVEEQFTASMEADLDTVSRGELLWKELLKRFWTGFWPLTEETQALKTADVILQVEKDLADHLFKGDTTRTCPTCKEGTLHLRLGTFGPFLSCSRYPDCRHITSLEKDADEESPANASLDLPRVIGEGKAIQETITLRKGPYGLYLQWGEGKKPKRVGLPKGMSIEEVSLEVAEKLGQFPISLGQHPQTQKEMIGGLGRFGPYVKHDGAFTSIKDINLLLEKRFDEILKIIEEQTAKKAAPSKKISSKAKKSVSRKKV